MGFDQIKVEKAVSVETEEEVVHQEFQQLSPLQAPTTEYIDYDEALPDNVTQVNLEDLLGELQQIKSELSNEKDSHEQTKIALEQEKRKVYAAELDLDHERIELQEEKDNYSSVLVELSKEKMQKQQIKNEIGWNEKEIESIVSKTNELESEKQRMDLEMAQMQEQHRIEIENEKKNHQKIKNELGWNEQEIESIKSKTSELESAKQSMDLEMAQMQEQHRIEIENEKKNHQKIKNG